MKLVIGLMFLASLPSFAAGPMGSGKTLTLVGTGRFFQSPLEKNCSVTASFGKDGGISVYGIRDIDGRRSVGLSIPADFEIVNGRITSESFCRDNDLSIDQIGNSIILKCEYPMHEGMVNVATFTLNSNGLESYREEMYVDGRKDTFECGNFYDMY